MTELMRPSIRWILAATILLGSSPAWAGGPLCPGGPRETNRYTIYLDVDGDPATGGTVTVEQAGEAPHDEPGIDHISFVETGCNEAGDVEVRRSGASDWSGAAFLVTEGPVSYPVGIGLGTMGLDVIEWQATRSRFPACIPRAFFHASLVENDFNDYTQPFSIGACQSVLEVPVSGGVGRFVLAFCLGLGSLLLLRRLSGGAGALTLLLAVIGAATLAGIVLALPIMLDGDPGDWAGIPVAVTDPLGDQSSAFASEDLQFCYVAEDFVADRLSFRCDVTDATDIPAPP